ncbi:MAG: NAD(P)/FAD-dependent oxidoreductase [Bacteroidetes bacterium]|nr:MAG: NAD(P)/FAD-dependent oxidoreductase [Bacteroidota bacterium]
MADKLTYDLAIVGGGLAGLALSVQIANAGYNVVLFEKEQFPFHRVCGEYISLESWDFLERLGVDLSALNVSRINRLCVSAVNGNSFEQDLPLGGFGISRYQLDHTLAQIAKNAGVRLQEQERVNEINFADPVFNIETSKENYKAGVVIGSFGKRSNLDIKWKRPFTIAKKNKLNNYIGIKYHVRCNYPADTIALHNFKKGYCGIVKVEDDRYCLCYLTTASNLQDSSNDIKKMEQTILSINPHLKKLLNECEMISEEPVIISQISFDKKELIKDHVLMIGDAAGMITPLCGNGMSMALHASKIAAEQVSKFLEGTISRESMEHGYLVKWEKLFASRLRTGRILQRLFNSEWLTSLMIRLGKSFPGLITALIKKTHGHPF